MHRAHIDDAAAPLLVHLFEGCARDQERAVKVDRKHAFPISEPKILERSDNLYAGVAHQHINSTESLDHAGHGMIDLRFVAHVDDYGDRLSAVAIEFRSG